MRAAVDDGVRAGIFRDVAVGWIDGAQHGAWFAGQASAESRFEVGALSEVFSGVLLAQLAYQGKLRLQTTLRETLPDIAFADAALGAATLESLASHATALPAVPPNLFPVSTDDLYADYDRAQLRLFLANYRRPPDIATGYSPLQFGILAQAVAAGGDFPALLRDKVLTPLGLTHTDFGDAGLLDAHARGAVVAHWHFNALQGSGGLRSTVDDLRILLKANLRPESAPLRAALLLARQPRDSDAALGWNIKPAMSGEHGWPILWRGSVTGGMAAFFAFRTDSQRAVVLLGDTDSDLSAIGMSYMDGLSPPFPARRPPDTQPIEPADFTGLYQVKGGREIVVRARDRALWLQLHGEPAMLLHNDGDDTFDAGTDALVVSFQREGRGVTSLVLSRGGVSLLAQRLTERAPHLARTPVALSREATEELCGDYGLGEALLRIARDGDKLGMQLTGRAAIGLVPFAPDRLACEDDSCDLTVRRDAQHAVIGIDVDLAGGQRFASRVNWKKP